MKIVIPDYRAPSRNKTITSHWRTYQKYRNEASELVAAYAKKRTTISPARVTITAYFKGKRAVDTSNIDDKMWIDALMHIGILREDDPTENPEVVKRAFVSCGFDRVEIEVVEPPASPQQS